MINSKIQSQDIPKSVKKSYTYIRNRAAIKKSSPVDLSTPVKKQSAKKTTLGNMGKCYPPPSLLCVFCL
jgi:hypothetical protein